MEIVVSASVVTLVVVLTLAVLVVVGAIPADVFAQVLETWR
jgi:hypothetical protein